MPDFGKDLLQLTLALFKHQASLWLGEETIGIAGRTLIDMGGEKLQGSLDKMLATEDGQKEILKAVQRADAHFQEHCNDPDLRGAFTLSFGNLETVLAAITDLPKAMDSSRVEKAIREALKRDVPALTSVQMHSGARLYTESLQRALVPIREFTLPVIAQIVQDIRSRVDDIGGKVDDIGAGQKRIEDRLIGLTILDRQRLRPSPPRPSKPMRGRKDEFQKVRDMLAPRSRAAITATVQVSPPSRSRLWLWTVPAARQ
jgi:hypothetical protein